MLSGGDFLNLVPNTFNQTTISGLVGYCISLFRLPLSTQLLSKRIKSFGSSKDIKGYISPYLRVHYFPTLTLYRSLQKTWSLRYYVSSYITSGRSSRSTKHLLICSLADLVITTRLTLLLIIYLNHLHLCLFIQRASFTLRQN